MRQARIGSKTTDETREKIRVAVTGRVPSGENHHSSKLSDEDVLAIRLSSESQNTLARRFKVGQDHISRIRSNKVRKGTT